MTDPKTTLDAPDAWPEAVQRAWAHYEALRRLGFDGRTIRVGVARGDLLGAMTQVVRVELVVGGREFGAHVAAWPDAPQAFDRWWSDFGDCLVDGRLSDATLQAIWDAHYPGMDLVAALQAKGIRIPRGGS